MELPRGRSGGSGWHGITAPSHVQRSDAVLRHVSLFSQRWDDCESESSDTPTLTTLCERGDQMVFNQWMSDRNNVRTQWDWLLQNLLCGLQPGFYPPIVLRQNCGFNGSATGSDYKAPCLHRVGVCRSALITVAETFQPACLWDLRTPLCSDITCRNNLQCG